MIRVAITPPVTLPIPIHSGYLNHEQELGPLLLSHGIQLVSDPKLADFELRCGYSLVAGPPPALPRHRVIIVDGEPPQPGFILPYYGQSGYGDILSPVNLRTYSWDGLAYYPNHPRTFERPEFHQKILQLITYRSDRLDFIQGTINGETPFRWRRLAGRHAELGLKIREEFGDLIAIGGHGWPNGIAFEDSRAGNWGPRKTELLREHSFVLCWENTEIPYYVTEKLWDPILAGSLPLYWGPDEMHARLPENTIIDCRRYAHEEGFDVAGLVDEVLTMSEEEWRGRVDTLREWYLGFGPDARRHSLRSSAHSLADAILQVAERSSMDSSALSSL